LHITFGISEYHQKLTSDASEIFKKVGWLNSRLFTIDEITQEPNILGVGYVEDAPVVAAGIANLREPSLAGVDYTMETRRLLDVPYLAIRGLATAQEYRRHGYATEMINAAILLAKGTGFQRVSASDVTTCTSEAFWRSRRFVQPPRLPYSDDLIRESYVPIEGAVGAFITVAPEVMKRFSDFSSRDLSVSGQRPR
jgi:GNAT superfamily N-acetyltransferase